MTKQIATITRIQKATNEELVSWVEEMLEMRKTESGNYPEDSKVRALAREMFKATGIPLNSCQQMVNEETYREVARRFIATI